MSNRELDELRAKDEERRRKANARKARWRARHPEADRRNSKQRTVATRDLVSRHKDEYQELCQMHKADGTDPRALYRKARAELRERYPDEWADLLAAT